MRLLYLCLLMTLWYSCQKKDATTPNIPPPKPTSPSSTVPVISSIIPSTASPNTLVAIRGTHFSPTADSDKVAFNGVSATVQSASDTVIQALVPSGGSNGPVTISTGFGSVTGPVFTYGPDIYIAGYERTVGSIGGNAVAKYWKNGVSMPLIGNDDNGYAYGISLTDTDVYVVGRASSTGSFHAYYWTREGYFQLSAGANDGQANAISIVNGNVYAVGNCGTGPTLWINGVADSLPHFSVNANVDAIAVAGNDIYIGGNCNDTITDAYTRGAYWKNDSMEYLSQMGFGDETNVTGIVVSGTDVYAVGTESRNLIGFAVIWKNGVATYLTDGSIDAAANAIQVVNGDVYVAGYEVKGAYSVATYWKNGVAVPLTNGQTNAAANAIVVVGSNIYVGGYESNTPDLILGSPDAGYVAKYWLNGIPVQLGAGLGSSQAYAIAIK